MRVPSSLFFPRHRHATRPSRPGEGLHPRRPVEHGGQGEDVAARVPGAAAGDARPVQAPSQKDGKWIERDDVWIKFLDRKGKLTVGYGSPKCIGPELEFGTRRRRSLRRAGAAHQDGLGRPQPVPRLPPAERRPAARRTCSEKMLTRAQKKKPEATLDDIKKPFGASYRAMLDEVNATLADLEDALPRLRRPGLRTGRLRLVPGLERHDQRRLHRRVRRPTWRTSSATCART